MEKPPKFVGNFFFPFLGGWCLKKGRGEAEAAYGWSGDRKMVVFEKREEKKGRKGRILERVDVEKTVFCSM